MVRRLTVCERCIITDRPGVYLPNLIFMQFNQAFQFSRSGLFELDNAFFFVFVRLVCLFQSIQFCLAVKDDLILIVLCICKQVIGIER